MKGIDFIGRFTDIVAEHTKAHEEINYPAWVSVKRAIYQLLAEAGDEARCSHPELSGAPNVDGYHVICLVCGRRPSPLNTLEEKYHA